MDPARWGMPRSPLDDARWADAEAVLDRYPHAEAGDWRPRAAGADRWLAAAVAVLLAAVGVAAWAWVADARDRPLEAAGTWSGLFTAAGFVLQFTGLVVAVRVNALPARSQQPLVVLSRAQRRSLRDQLRGRAPLEPRRLPLVRWLAERDAVSPAAFVQSCGAGTWVVALGMDGDDAQRVLGAVIGLGCLAGCAWVVAVARRGRRFLAAHPYPADLRQEG